MWVMQQSASLSKRRELEGLHRSELELYQVQKFNDLVRRVLPVNRFYSQKLASFRLPIRTLEDLRSLPFTTKQELMPEDPEASIYARHLTYEISAYQRLHRTSGTHGRPLVVLDTAEDWNWWIYNWQFVLDAAQVTSEDRVLMAFSFGPFIGFWSANDALLARGALVIPGGGLSTLARLELLFSTQATLVCCTPSYALHLAESATHHQMDLKGSHVRALIVAGEPGGSVPTIAAQIQDLWGAEVIDHAGATEIGPWGYASADRSGLHIVETEFIAEFLRIEDDEPADDDELAELVLTSLGRPGAPLIRYRTGDLVRPRRAGNGENHFAFLPGGVWGRVDDMMIIRGVNIYPSAIEQILREVAGTCEYRLIASRQGAMDQLQLEIENQDDAELNRLTEILRLRLGLQVAVHSVPTGTLPRFEHKARRVIDQRI